MPSHPYAPYLASHVAPTFGTIRGRATAPNSTTGCSRRRASRAGAIRSSSRSMAGPARGGRSTRAWASPIQQYLAQHGWIVFSLDNRGSPDRGKAFENAHLSRDGHGRGRGPARRRRLAARPGLCRSGAIAVYGWSYGGYMTLQLLEAAPGTFAAGVAGAPVTRWELYDTHYTERYLGNPSIDPAPYRASGAIPNAGRIADPLLLVHGMADDNVVFENSTVLMAALQAAGRPFEMMVYPGATHGVSGEARQLHLWRTITRFLDRTARAQH